MLRIEYVTGYAGTGKSTELIKLVESLPQSSTIVIAPTHKALDRLRHQLPHGTEYRTIHSMLGWIPSINEDAKNINQIDTTIKLNRELYEYTHIVIDEAGMMSEDMLFEITSKIEEAQDYGKQQGADEKLVIIHCFLDPYQLLPVRGTQIQVDPSTTKKLTTQYRSDSPDVVNLYTKFVQYLQHINKKDLTTPYSENVKPLDITKFKRDDRMLAYTNEAVGAWNQKIAAMFNITSYEGQEVQLGNMLDTVIVDSILDITQKDLFDLVDWYKAGKLILQNNQINKVFLDASIAQLIRNENISFIKDIFGHVYPVIIGIAKANRIIKETKENALKDKRNFKDVYALNRSFIMDYTFATTVHKAQGSEFDTVFIDKKDIQRSITSGYYNTYARLMYVAISRAKKIIYI